jgi:hypothetical protein
MMVVVPSASATSDLLLLGSCYPGKKCQQATTKEGTHQPLEHLPARGGTVG